MSLIIQLWGYSVCLPDMVTDAAALKSASDAPNETRFLIIKYVLAGKVFTVANVAHLMKTDLWRFGQMGSRLLRIKYEAWNVPLEARLFNNQE